MTPHTNHFDAARPTNNTVAHAAESGQRPARKIGNRRQKERRRPKRKEQNVTPATNAPMTNRPTSRLPRPTTTTSTTTTKQAEDQHVREVEHELDSYMAVRDATRLGHDRKGRRGLEHGDETPPPAPTTTQEGIDVKDFVDEAKCAWRDRVKSVLRPPDAEHLLNTFSSALPSPKPRLNKLPFPTLEEVKAAIPTTGIEIHDLFQTFELHQIDGREDEFDALPFRASHFDHMAGRLFPGALPTAAEAQPVIPEQGVRAPGDVVDKVQPAISDHGTSATDPASALRHEALGPPEELMTEELQTAIPDQGIDPKDLVPWLGPRYSGHIVRVSALTGEVAMVSRATGLAVRRRADDEFGGGVVGPIAAAWRQEPGTSAWSLVEEVAMSAPVSGTVVVAPAEAGSAEITSARKSRSAQHADRTDVGGDDASPAGIEMIDGRVNGSSADSLHRGEVSGEGKATERAPISVVGDNNSDAQATEAAKNAGSSPGVGDTSSFVSTTPAPKARAGERPSPGWRVGKDPWLSPGPEGDGEKDVTASMLVRASTAVFDGRVEEEMEKGKEDEGGPVRHDDQRVAAGHEGCTTEHADEVDEGCGVTAPDREASVVAPDEQQCTAADEQTPSPPQVDRRRSDEVTTPHEQEPATTSDRQTSARDKPIPSGTQVEKPSAPDQIDEATALPDLPPLARGEQSRLEQKITDGALHSPQREPAEDHAQEDG
ncbi:hypothetical protein B0A55_11776, partial [Friedmanniomyces simplex]